MSKKLIKKGCVYVLCALIFYTLGRYGSLWKSSDLTNSYISKESLNFFLSDNKASMLAYDRSMPLIFVGGMPRSGTTLMRALLDAHSDIRCGEETRAKVIPRVLALRGQWTKSQKEIDRMLEGGITDEVLYSAVAAFILEVIVKHGEPAPRLCNKDPFTLKYVDELKIMFPQAKYILMIRDGRAVVHSIINRKVTITGFDLNNYETSLQKWNTIMTNMYKQCMNAGPSRCLMVYYEQLVLHPRDIMTKVLKFLDIPWDERVMHHEDYINKPGGISLSKIERSTDQVIKPVNLEALTKWASSFPDNLKGNVRQLAPMLEKLGYDPDEFPPNYGAPDANVWSVAILYNVHSNVKFMRLLVLNY
ncbi:hypothetical protein HELRODRAFT_77670 [Helobdella robusta]|uniref:Protein-tyrosine sulfotransferase n=1 Tax=Helobdella robusta TaxID=6412 RepID=T1G319_HELRO|nr:hypothetical protein HELRODRAFT_77670 [Helobdella robusta]ESO05199.1 hypothetical protein HELRODRAFT_77670 [Helobdella robusta]